MKKSAAFTIAEIAVTLFVIAIIATVSFTITKHKIDNSVKYSYYAVFDVLSNVTANVIADANAAASYIVEHPPEDSEPPIGAIGDGAFGNTFTDSGVVSIGDSAFGNNTFTDSGDVSVGVKSPGSDDVFTDTVVGGIGDSAFGDDNYTDYGDRVQSSTVVIPTITTLPIKWSGEDNLCEKISEKLNTSKVSCSTYTTEGNFSEDKAAIVLNNGVRLFITEDYPVTFDMLNLASGDDSMGYVIYADIDGSRKNGVLYEDVFPFYLTVSGKVIPGYDASKIAGGNDKNILSVSVRYDNFKADGKREVMFLKFNDKKETSFQQAACASGKLVGTYCGSIVKDALCTDSADCTMVYNKPFKF